MWGDTWQLGLQLAWSWRIRVCQSLEGGGLTDTKGVGRPVLESPCQACLPSFSFRLEELGLPEVRECSLVGGLSYLTQMTHNMLGCYKLA